MRNRIVVIIVLFIVLSMSVVIQVARLDSFNCHIKNQYLGVFNTPYKTADSIPETEINAIPAEKYLIIFHPGDSDSFVLATNIINTLKYMKKDYLLIDAQNDNGVYQSYRGVIVTFENLVNWSGLNKAINYVQNGGKVFFAKRPQKDGTLERISSILGVETLGESGIDDGCQLVSNVLIKARGYKATESFLFNSFIEVELKKDCTLYAKAPNGNPMIWEVPYGKGKFIVFNGTMLNIKINRGLITGILSLMEDNYIYPIHNIKVCYIDDFPAQVPTSFVRNVSKSYGRSFTGFYREVWWPDLLRTSKLYNIVYNGMFVETYNARVKPPFREKSNPAIASLSIYGREILRNGGEIGLHGYNHQPLAEPGFLKEEPDYRPWPSKANMLAALKETQRFGRSVFPDYKLSCYVPPSNMLSPIGREALRETMPNLKVIASIYGYNTFFKGDDYNQEFDVGDDGIINLPRITYGYENSEVNNWAAFNAVTSIGIYSHFVHPDDVADPYRNNNKTWEQLSKEYFTLQRTMYRKYQWLRSLTATVAGLEVEKYQNCQVFIEKLPDGIRVRCNQFPKEFYFILRTHQEVTVPQGCEASLIDDGVYLIRTTKPDFIIHLGGNPS